MTTGRTDEPSAATHETAREQYSANTEQVIAELCEALDGLKKKAFHHDGCFVSPCTRGVKKAVDKANEALSKARGAAG